MSDLQERFLNFSKEIVLFAKSLTLDTVSRPLVSQLVRSATSVGANYAEAQSGISRKDFRAKIYICQKEAEETKYWLHLLKTAFPEKQPELELFVDESQQIVKLLQSIINKLSLS